MQPGEREVIIRRQGSTPMVEIGYHIPSAAGPDLAALSVLGMMLAASPDGPLYQKLVNDATFAPKNLKRLEQALQQEISLALEKGFTQQELDDARQALQEEREAHLRDESGVLTLLSTNLYRGTDMKAWMDTDEKLARLTLDEVNAAFRRWFPADRALTVVAGSFDESAP